MKVLLVSASVSNRLHTALFKEYGISSGFAIQKFYRLIEEGLVLNSASVEALSIVPIKRAEAPFAFRRFRNEEERGIKYHYLPYMRYAPLYHLLVLITLCFKVFWWCIRNRKDSVVICDILIPSVGIGTAWGTALARAMRIAWVTDMPGMEAGQKDKFDDMDFLGRIQVRAVRSFSAFIFTTRQANEKLNSSDKPYVVVEGFVSADSKVPERMPSSGPKTILYAGGLLEGYGLRFLCEAVKSLEDRHDIRLVIYGKGPLASVLKEYAANDPRIDFRGMATNDVIVKAEQSALLLVNPRFTGAEYTLYSYPSKNIEYMVSGTPSVTTRLAGIPEDNYPYIFTFDDESVEGYARTLDAILSKPEEELYAFGRRAAEYIIKTRSSDVQVRRILDLTRKVKEQKNK